MRYKDLFTETSTALLANKVRSSLTVLGIVIGIASVIALVSIGQGATSSITSSIDSLGSNLITVSPGASRGSSGFSAMGARGNAKTLTNEDAEAISAQVEDVSAVTTTVTGRYQITAKGTNTNTSVTGVTANYAEVRNVSVDEGYFISESQNANASKVAVLGPTVLTDLFGDEAVASDAIGQSIRINGSEFKVIGVTVSKGTSGMSNQDDIIYIPVTTAQRYLSGNKYLSGISVEAASTDVMTQVQADITSLLLTRHKISDSTNADFSVSNQNDLLSTMSSITTTLTYLLAAIAGISLLVGGIGIMNMMLTTVTERTREIGLRKAIGAQASDISVQFLIEAITLTMVGGVIGIALGSIISFLVNWSGLMSTTVSLYSVLISFGVSAGIGILFGWYPASRAASLNPIEALRYE